MLQFAQVVDIALVQCRFGEGGSALHLAPKQGCEHTGVTFEFLLTTSSEDETWALLVILTGRTNSEAIHDSATQFNESHRPENAAKRVERSATANEEENDDEFWKRV